MRDGFVGDLVYCLVVFLAYVLRVASHQVVETVGYDRQQLSQLRVVFLGYRGLTLMAATILVASASEWT